MFVKDSPVLVHVTLPKTSNFASYASLTAFDVSIELPNKTVIYEDDITGYGGATYVTTVTATVDGEITFSYTPTQTGIYKIKVTTGAAGSHTIIGSTMLSVISPATSVVIAAKL